MDLKIIPSNSSLIEGLGISEERADQLLKSAEEWLKKEMKSATGSLDKLDLLKQCASFSENLEEYTLLATNVDPLIENCRMAIHEETCPRCRAKREARERKDSMEDMFSGFTFRSRGAYSRPDVQQVAPGVFIINI